MTLNLIKTADSGTSPAFGKGPSQSHSPPGTATLNGLGQGFLSIYTHLIAPTSALQLPQCGQWTHPCMIQPIAQFPGKPALKDRSFEHLSCNINQGYWASWIHFSITTSSNRIHHKTRKEMKEDQADSAKCSSWGSSGKPWRFIFLQLLPQRRWILQQRVQTWRSFFQGKVFKWLFIIMSLLCDPWTEPSVEKTWKSSSRH